MIFGEKKLLISVASLIGGVAIGILLLLSFLVWDYGFSGHEIQGESQALVYIPAGTGVREIGHILEQEKLLKNDFRFAVLARMMGIGHRLKAGEYLLPRAMSPFDLLKILASGKTFKRIVTVPEGTTLSGVADILADQKLVDRQAFLDLCRNPVFLEKMGVKAASLEGYLFPDTYYFTRGTPADEIARILKARADTVWLQMEGDKFKGDLSRYEVITLASIVEKETGDDSERPLVARVFLERLHRGMLLQADPTVIYGRGESNQPLSRADLTDDQPYNTYVHKGLPPGPIANPGRLALESVLHPSEEAYLYFVSKNDGTHYFSADLKEHNRAVRKYRKKKNGGP